jgi:acetyl esterase/lipase
LGAADKLSRADPLRDEALIYEHLLKEAGVEVKVDVFAGIPHGGPDFFPMHSVAKKAVDGVVKAMEWMLEARK